MQNEEKIGPKRASEMIGTPVSWIYQRIHDRNLPFPYYKVGHYVRFRESDINAFLESVRIDHYDNQAIGRYHNDLFEKQLVYKNVGKKLSGNCRYHKQKGEVDNVRFN